MYVVCVSGVHYIAPSRGGAPQLGETQSADQPSETRVYFKALALRTRTPGARALLPVTRSRSSGPLGALLSSPALDVRLITALQVLQDVATSAKEAENDLLKKVRTRAVAPAPMLYTAISLLLLLSPVAGDGCPHVGEPPAHHPPVKGVRAAAYQAAAHAVDFAAVKADIKALFEMVSRNGLGPV